MNDEGAARAAAEVVLAEWPSDPGNRPVVWRIEEHSRVGASPIVVEKDGGEIHVHGSGPDHHQQLEEWLD